MALPKCKLQIKLISKVKSNDLFTLLLFPWFSILLFTFIPHDHTLSHMQSVSKS